MKVALSASYYRIPAIKRLLDGCEVIYTSNVRARDELWEALGSWRVHFTPNASEAMHAFLRSQHPDAEFIGFNDIRYELEKLVRDSCEETIRALAGPENDEPLAVATNRARLMLGMRQLPL